jgi:hypothetical protein
MQSSVIASETADLSTVTSVASETEDPSTVIASPRQQTYEYCYVYIASEKADLSICVTLHLRQQTCPGPANDKSLAWWYLGVS